MKLDYLSFLSGNLPEKIRKKESLLLKELIKLKEADNLYHIFEGDDPDKTPGERGLGSSRRRLELPAKIYPGLYALEMIAFKEGKGPLLHSSTSKYNCRDSRPWYPGWPCGKDYGMGSCP